MTTRDPRPVPAGEDSADVQSYIDGLASGGEAAPSAHFTLERGRAQELLAQRRLARPTDWVLLAVQAAVLRDATYLLATVTDDEVELTFDGTPFTREALERCPDEALAPIRTDDAEACALRKLALALGAVRGLDWQAVTVASGDGRTGVELTARPGEEDAIGPLADPRPGTRITVKRRRSDPVDPYLPEDPGEARALRERCLHLAIPLTVNGRPAPRQERFAFALEEVPFGQDAHRGVAFVAPRFDHPPALDVVQHGVLVHRRPFPGGMEHGVAVVDAPALRTDLTDLEAVQGPELEALFTLAMDAQATARSRVDLARRLPAWLNAEAVRHLDVIAAAQMPRRMLGFLIDWLIFFVVLQIIVLPLTWIFVLETLEHSPWLLVGVVEVATVALALGLAALWPVSLRPGPADPVSRLIDDRLGGHPALYEAAARIVWTSRPALRGYFPEPLPALPASFDARH